MDIEASLAQFFQAHQQKAWEPGAVDCCLFLADWTSWLGYDDAASNLRGSYDSEAGFQEIIRVAGGLVNVVSGCASRIGLNSIKRPVIGAIGVIGSETVIERQWGAIFDGHRWQVRFTNRIGPMAASPLAIWSI